MTTNTLWSKKLVLTGHLSQAQQNRLQDLFPGLQIIDCSDDRERRSQALRDAHFLFGFLSPEQFREAKNLEFIQVWSQGVEAMLYPEFLESDVPLSNGKDLWSPAMAEFTIAVILAFHRRLPQLVHWQREHTWAPDRSGFRFFSGSTVAFLGTGSIARHTAPLCKAFDCRILGHNQRGDKPDGFDEVFTGDGLYAMLGESDVVVSTLPNTPQTRHFMDRAAFRAMKDTALFINVGRGATVDEQALIEALREGWIGGAGLDVTEKEPLPADSPLWDMPNVIITGHTSGLGQDNSERAFGLLVENLERLRDGRPLLNLVDKKLGY